MPNPQAPRIVSLLPSATEILDILDMTPYVVGRSHECDYPAEIGDRPICTTARLNTSRPSLEIDQDVQTLLNSALSIYDVKVDVLKQLQPTHIVTQDQCDVCAVTFSVVEQAVAMLAEPRPQVISLQPETLADVWADIERVANHLDIDATPALTTLHQRVNQCQQKAQRITVTEQPRVATIEWIEPLMGGGNWVPELVALAGGINLFGTVGQHSPYISWETLLAADPDVIIVMPCGFDLDRTHQEMQEIVRHPQWQELRAVQTNHLYITDGNAYFNRPGPRLVDSLEILVEILQSRSLQAEQSQFRYQTTGWRRYRPSGCHYQ